VDRRREEKARLREAYRAERAVATTEAEQAEVIARWARGLDRTNRATRRAQRAHATAQREEAALESALAEAQQAEQRAKVAAEAGEAACLGARVQLAACEERAARLGRDLPPPAPGLVPPAPGRPPPMPTGAPSASRGPGPGRPMPVAGPAAPRPGPAGAGAAGPPRPAPLAGQTRVGQGGPTVIEALASRDRRALEMVARVIAEHTGRPPAQVLLQVREFVDSILAVASQRGYMTVEGDHPFWARLTDDEDRDVLAALVRMGFQVEPPTGWRGGRAPVSSDLTMALAYAGIEVRAMRNLPTALELRDLPRSVAVDARALLVAEAPDLSLDHVVPMLEERADPLAPLWEEWGQIRLLLLGDPRALGLRPG
jgi:hypothetical protein